MEHAVELHLRAPEVGVALRQRRRGIWRLDAQSMIPRSGYRFLEKIMLKPIT